MTLRFLLLSTLVCLFGFSYAQDGNWKKISKSADQLYATGNYEEAANYFLEAYKLKSSQSNFLFKAADCYSKIRAHNKAANLYKELRGNNEYPLAGLQYARALKQSGDHREAISAFKTFLVNYKGSDSSAYIKIIKTEVEGCELAINAKESQNDLMIEHLSDNINTIANEVAPVPFNDEILYFSSTMDGFSKIFRSQFQNGDWSEAVVPSFPEFKDKHACHGSFTPDFKRFYFTLCNTTDFDVVNGECDIYVTVREDGAWKTPRKLRDYVKLEGTTATHPFVVHDEEMEIIYFSSDRKGGKGGMDIWYMTRHVDSPDYDFTLPKNAGANINTIANEISPFYNLEEGFLYFSSDGHPSMGGFDVFKSMGSMNKFTIPQNMGTPINSFHDDYYYVQTPGQSSGFLSSNRTHGQEKVNTDNDDIFFFTIPVKEVFASGNVYDKSNNSLIKDVQIILYEIKSNGKKRLLQSVIANNGAYQFALIPEKKFQIEAIKEGYMISGFNFNTMDFNPEKEYGKAVYLDKEAMVISVDEPIFNEAASVASVNPLLSGEDKEEIETFEKEMDTITPEPVRSAPNNTSPSIAGNSTKPLTAVESYINSYYQDMAVTTTAPKQNGTYYKVQISTAGSFNKRDPQFNSLRGLGRFETEYIEAKGWTRILMADYNSLSEAREIMEEARASGFPESFVVKYRNGKRIN